MRETDTDTGQCPISITGGKSVHSRIPLHLLNIKTTCEEREGYMGKEP